MLGQTNLGDQSDCTSSPRPQSKSSRLLALREHVHYLTVSGGQGSGCSSAIPGSAGAAVISNPAGERSTSRSPMRLLGCLGSLPAVGWRLPRSLALRPLYKAVHSMATGSSRAREGPRAGEQVSKTETTTLVTCPQK